MNLSLTNPAENVNRAERVESLDSSDFHFTPPRHHPWEPIPAYVASGIGSIVARTRHAQGTEKAALVAMQLMEPLFEAAFLARGDMTHDRQHGHADPAVQAHHDAGVRESLSVLVEVYSAIQESLGLLR